jgi:NAD(P)-dependent dehydrogenase (short-subunit alcohol dehydrogenase family)
MRNFMNLASIRKAAFGMRVYNPANRPPYRFLNREYLIISYQTDFDALHAVVPEPLHPENDIVHDEFIRIPDSSGFGDYTESGQIISVRERQGCPGNYTDSKLKAVYVTAKHGLLGLARVVAKEGRPRGVRANVVCPGFVRTPLVDKQIPEQAKAFGMSEAEVVRNVLLKETVDSEFTTAADVANTVAFLAGFESSALTGQSVIVSHGWTMQ